VKRFSSGCILAVVAFCTFTTSVARADEIADLEKSLAQEHAALSTSDCSAACRALASIRRAADKICAIEQGPRCAAAHAKSDDATRRVREACPECAIASIAPEKPTSPAAHDVSPATVPPAVVQNETLRTASPPSPQRSRGGCASCHASGASLGEATTGVLAFLALAGLLRRKKKAYPSRSTTL